MESQAERIKRIRKECESEAKIASSKRAVANMILGRDDRGRHKDVGHD